MKSFYVSCTRKHALRYVSAITHYISSFSVCCVRCMKYVDQTWPDSRSKPLFGVHQNLFVASVRSVAFREPAFLYQLSLRRSLLQMIIKSSDLTDEHL